MNTIKSFTIALFLFTLFMSLNIKAGELHSRGWNSHWHMSFNGVMEYLVYVPKDLEETDKSPSLILGLHGCLQDAEAFQKGARLQQMADKAQAVLVLPKQTNFSNVYQCWNWFYPLVQNGYAEAALIAGIVEDVHETYQTKKGYNYVFGISAGAALTQVMAACYNHLFAAHAAHHAMPYAASKGVLDAKDVFYDGPALSASQSAKKALKCRQFSEPKKQMMPALVIQGDAGEMSLKHGPATQNQWLIFNDLTDNQRRDHSLRLKHSTSTVKPERRYSYRKDTWTDDRARPVVQHIQIKGLGHSWSGGTNRYDFNDPHGPDATEMIYQFFKKWGL